MTDRTCAAALVAMFILAALIGPAGASPKDRPATPQSDGDNAVRVFADKAKQERHKHIRRSAKIARIASLAAKSKNVELGSTAARLRQKELKRHLRTLNKFAKSQAKLTALRTAKTVAHEEASLVEQNKAALRAAKAVLQAEKPVAATAQ